MHWVRAPSILSTPIVPIPTFVPIVCSAIASAGASSPLLSIHQSTSSPAPTSPLSSPSPSPSLSYGLRPFTPDQAASTVQSPSSTPRSAPYRRPTFNHHRSGGLSKHHLDPTATNPYSNPKC
ncbi:hypothetical protein PVAP13_4NG100568 [Panicum virgatum]|uniref:Uncharacterized protein n=1 Tax=Panicum virgatum TaxID=38727 RepID=A0A8T0T5I8_PANVG|nr:hypothetical protein PVAP13_4NG100568 [Panicum virgatum]